MIGQKELLVTVSVLAALVSVYFYGVHNGKTAERAKWLDVQVETANQVADTIRGVHERNAEIEESNAALALEAEAQREENRRLAEDVQELIAQEPAVEIRRIEVPANCPVVECPVPDIARDYRLHNCAISPAHCSGVRATGAPSGGDGTVPLAADTKPGGPET